MKHILTTGLLFSVSLILPMLRHSLFWLLLGTGAYSMLHAQSTATPAATSSASQRDGQHDFDFELGAWNTHLKVLRHPLTGSGTWVDYQGTSVVHSIWRGRANMVELEVDGPTGHLEAINLRLYNPTSHQWSLNFANASEGTMSIPTVGEFKNGRGEFYDQEAINGRMILVRDIWSNITANSCHFEQAFSDDGGKTWETNWIADDTRDASSKGKASSW